MVMKKEFGAAKMKRVRRYDLDEYLKGHGTSTWERPLAFDFIQNHVHYMKGSLAMYALQDYVGESTVNTVLADFVKDNAFQDPPYTTSMELVERFRAATPDELKYVVEDLFETITLHDLRTTSATWQMQDDGTYTVRLRVQARKLRAGDNGVETMIPINDMIDIGVMDRRGNMLYLKKHKIDSTDQEIEVVVTRVPAKAGIDPRNILIDRKPDDNVVPVRPD